jgi:thiol-disulfide isomerase/thioredoxin
MSTVRTTEEDHLSITRRTHSDLSALDRAPVWLNSEPLKAEELRGRVVLADIWTYSCVNWLRTLPYVRAWADRYRDRGLVVIGVHCPEFGFEHDLDNVRQATRELGVGYPVVIDNDFAIWQSLANRAWPAVHLVDRDGRVRYRHFGEGSYDETERVIQHLLGIDEETVRVEADGLAEPADWDRLGTGETYVGSGRGAGRVDSPSHLALNHWALSGDWDVEEESAVLNAAGGSVTFRFHARDVNLVLTPPASGAPVRFTVLVDGEAPRDDHGVDVDESGQGSVDQPRMYQLVRQLGGAAERTFEIMFHDPGVRAYVFTFG